MSTPTTERLRVLVSDYYHGLVTFESYREQRGQLLDTLGAPPRAESQPAPVPKPIAVDRTQTRAEIAAPPPTALPTRPQKSSPRLAAIAAGVVIVAVGGAVAYLQLDPADDAQQTTAPADVASLSPGEALLERFIDRNTWDRDAASTLAVAWNNALSEPDRTLAIASPSFRRFSDALRRRLREEEALAGGNTSAELETLSTLAAGLGVRYTATTATTASPAAATSAPTSPATRAGSASATGNPGVGAPTSAVTSSPTPPAAEPEPEPVVQTAPAGSAPAVASEVTPAPSPPGSAAPVSATPAANPPAAAPVAEQSAAAASTTTRSSACSAQLLNTRRPLCTDALASGGNAPALAIIPAGSFSMGDAQTASAAPAHAVTIGAPFAMSIYEVSFADFRTYCTRSGRRCPDNPWSDDAYPVVLVSWTEATSYAQWLSTETGQRYRLPSEAEWEYAARAGTTSAYPFGDNVTPAAARSSANGPMTSPLPSSDRSVNGNAFRLWHMIGNVREWVADGWYSDYASAPSDGSARSSDAVSSRAVRGGSYSDGVLPLKSAARLALEAGAQDPTTGFRVVRELTP